MVQIFECWCKHLEDVLSHSQCPMTPVQSEPCVPPVLLLMDLLSHPVNEIQQESVLCWTSTEILNEVFFSGPSIFKIWVSYEEKQKIKGNFIITFGQILTQYVKIFTFTFTFTFHQSSIIPLAWLCSHLCSSSSEVPCVCQNKIFCWALCHSWTTFIHYCFSCWMQLHKW